MTTDGASRLRIPLLPRWLRVAAFCGVVTVIVYFSLLDAPSPPGPPGPWWDKQLHFAAYGALVVATAQATVEYRDRGLARIAAALAFVLAFGVAVELAQWPLADRYASLGDVVANAAGTALGATAFWVEAKLGYADGVLSTES